MPRTNLPPHIFFERMKKKPALQSILDNIDDYSIEQLETIKGQPLWIRKQLVRIKQQKEGPSQSDSELIAEKLADMMSGDPKQEEINRNQTYEIRKWVGGDWQMPSGRTGIYTVEIKPNDYFLVYQPGRVKIQSSISNMNQTQWNYFLSYTQCVGHMTIKQFIEFSNGILTQKHPDATEIQLQDDTNSDVDDRGFFRIVRH